MSTKVIIELIVDNEAFYSGTDENIKNYIIEIQKLTKTFSYVKECNIVSIVREGGRLGHVITDDLGKLKNTLKILLDETIPIEERIRRIRDKNSNDYHKWFGSAYYTPILLVVYPKKYPVINEIVKDALQKTGLYPNYDSKPEWRAYAEVIPKIQQLAEQYHLSLWQIDSVWWKYQMKMMLLLPAQKNLY